MRIVSNVDMPYYNRTQLTIGFRWLDKQTSCEYEANVHTSGTVGVSDAALVGDCLNGDQRAWEELLHRYKRLIYAVTVRFHFETEDRHDVFQAVCLETLKGLPSLRQASSLRYWILTITLRQCSALLRRKREERSNHSDETALAIQ